jgi:hypothetical protein
MSGKLTAKLRALFRSSQINDFAPGRFRLAFRRGPQNNVC